MHNDFNAISAEEALERLLEGNRTYTKLEELAEFMGTEKLIGNISRAAREDTCKNGQHPYAVIITCSDSRVIPEAIFQAGIGDLFVIRVAGNVMDNHQLGSVEYALSHLGCRLVVVLGHTQCGAVDAAIHHDPDGCIKYITDEIKKAIGDEKDETAACRLNVAHSVSLIESNIESNAKIRQTEELNEIKVVGALYHIDSGKVELL